MLWELVKLREERAASIEGLKLVYPNKGSTVVKPTTGAKVKARVETTAKANTSAKTTIVAKIGVLAAVELTVKAGTTVAHLTLTH